MKIWTLVSSNTRIAGSEDTLCLSVMLKNHDVSNVMGLTRSNITTIWLGVIKQTLRLTLYILKPNRVNHILIHSNAWTVKVITRWILTHIYSGDIASIRNGTLKSIKNSGISKTSQFAQPWAVFKYDFKKSQTLFIKCLGEQNSYGYYSRILHRFQHSFYLETPLVFYLFYTEFFKWRRK